MESIEGNFVQDPAFLDVTLAEAILAPMPGAEEYEAQRQAMPIPEGVTAGLHMFYAEPLLSKEQEQHLFRQMNLLKYQANQLMGNPCQAAQIKLLHEQAQAVRNHLVAANLRLIFRIAKRQLAWPAERDGPIFAARTECGRD